MQRYPSRLSRAAPLWGAVLCLAALSPLPGQGDDTGPAPVRRLAPYFRRPDGSALHEITSQLGEGVRVATVPAAYRLNGGRVEAARWVPAFLYGDVDADGRAEYVVGCYVPPGSSARPPRDNRARLMVFKRSGGHWMRAWTSPGLGYRFDRPRYNAQEVEDGLDALEHLRPPIDLVDLGGDGCLAIAYFAWSESESTGALPGVYRWDGRRWQNVGPQADRFSLRDLNGDGRAEVVAGTPYVGYGSGDDDVPHIYRWRNERFEEASAQFPAFYADLARRYRQHVRRMEAAHTPFAQEVWTRAIQQAEALAAHSA